MIEQIQSLLPQDNQFFSGGLILMLLGAALAYLRDLPGQLLNLGERMFIVKAEVRDQTIIRWFDTYLEESSYGKRCRRLKISLDHSDDESRPVLSPGFGAHLIRIGSRPYWVTRSMDTGGDDSDGSMASDLAKLLKKDVVKIRTFGRRRESMNRLVAEAQEHYRTRNKDRRSTIHVNHHGSSWLTIKVGQPRTIDSVHMPSEVAGDVLRSIQTFLTDDRREWYESRGIPYRLGLLFEGPPGGGKSSLAKALASRFDMGIYVLDPSRPYLDDMDVVCLLADLPPRSLLLVEDVDCDVLVRDPRSRSEATSRVTLKGFLNALDGVAAGEGRVLVMTTNHPETLDHALLRPGRTDHRYYIGPAEPEQSAAIYRRFFPETPDDWPLRFADAVPEGAMMAQIQGHLLRHTDSATAAIVGAHEITQEHRNGGHRGTEDED